MPTYRKLHAQAVESHDINDMPDDFTRLLWTLFPLALCREGRGIDNPSWVKSKVFPLRLDVTLEMVSGALDWYTDRGMIERYAVNGRAYFFLPTFHKFQGNTTKEKESIYPAPPEQVEDSPVPLPVPVETSSQQAPDQLPTNSVTDAVFNTQYSNADSDAIDNSDDGASPPIPEKPPPKKAATNSLPIQAQVFIEFGGKFRSGKRKGGQTKKAAAIEFMIEKVSDAPADLSFWGQVVDGYVRQWSSYSYTTMVNEYYLKGRIPGDGVSGGNAARSTYRTADEYPEGDEVLL